MRAMHNLHATGEQIATGHPTIKTTSSTIAPIWRSLAVELEAEQRVRFAIRVGSDKGGLRKVQERNPGEIPKAEHPAELFVPAAKG